ncbi:MAG TPA: YihY/virulence factor BrkB family protein [Crenalkalicoccus sp.]|nr:YihY/virulence factor BrkB family protein [Crenalkalicoccus sp.]
MAEDQKPNVVLAAVLGAGALLLAAFGRRRADGRVPATARSAHGRPAREDDAAARHTGRYAESPAEIPPRGWWQVLKRTFAEANKDRLMTEAAGVTFYTLLSVFPALAALISIFGLFADPATIEKQIQGLAGVIPGGGMDILTDQAHRIASQGSGTLGIGLVLGLATSLWSANQATKAMVDVLNIIYEEKEERGYLTRLAITMAFTFGGILLAILAVAAVIALPILFNYVGLHGGVFDLVLRYARWPILLVVVSLYLAALFRYGPHRRRARWRWVTWGSAFAAFTWLAVSLGFSWYVANFGNYNETYGSLGAVVGFMTWIWLSCTVVLVGAELDAELEHQTARDTTAGPEKPMGARGARMADEVA